MRVTVEYVTRGWGLLIEANGAQSVGTARAAWWIVSRVRDGRVEAMTVSWGREALLVVFGHEEEAGMFLWSLGPGAAENGWRVRETRCGELASVLCGPCRSAGGVALNPLPEMLEGGTVALVRVGKERFLARLLGPLSTGPAGPTRKRV